MKARRLAMLGSTVLVLGGCADLAELKEGECGNGLLEPEVGEDCDSAADPDCIPAGQPHECKIGCTTTEACLARDAGACSEDGHCVRADICGNRRLEAGEDCDGDEAVAEGGTCRAQGDDDECHFDCRLQDDDTRVACPVGWGCGRGDVCQEWDVCGNDFREAERGEDCDGSDTLQGGTCLGPDEANACHYDCSKQGGQRLACPDGWGCGPGDLCVQWGVCGNGVVEGNEDCDGSDDTGGTCLGPDAPNACRYDCAVGETGARPDCPQGWGCGSDELCVRDDVCGNGVVEPQVGEECEPAAAAPEELCGAPKTPEACRWRCASAAADVVVGCPDGWGCGLDGYCRHANGAFELAGSVSPGEPVSTLHIADFDGDGRSDLLLQTLGTSSALFLDEQGGLSRSVALPADQASPALGAVGLLSGSEVAPDVRDDALLLGSGAVSVYRGQADGSLKPTIYASLELDDTSVARDETALVSVDAMPATCAAIQAPTPLSPVAYWGRELLTLTTTVAGDNGTIGWQRAFYGLAGGAARLTGLPLPVSRLAGPVVVGELLPTPGELGAGQADPGCNCEELAYAFDGGQGFEVFSPCLWTTMSTLSWNSSDVGTQVGVPATKLQLPGGIVPPFGGICGPLQLVDANGDGALDVIVGVGNGDCSSLMPISVHYYVWLGEPAGTGAIKPWSWEGDADPDPLGFQFYETNLLPVFVDQMIVAMGHLNDDGIPDVVTQHGAYVSNGGSELRSALYYRVDPADLLPDGSLLTAATVADLNGDGLQDVVALASGGVSPPMLVHYLGAGGGALNPFVVPASHRPTTFDVGDFDGDLLLDVAFAESEGLSNTDVDTQLSVAFGTAFGSVDPPMTVGSLLNVERLHAHNFHDDGFEALSDLLAVTNPLADGEPTSLALLTGTPSRQLTSPFVLSAEVEGEDAYAIVAAAAVAGRFTPEGYEGYGDVAVLGASYFASGDIAHERGLWILPTRADAAVNPADVSWLGAPASGNAPLESWLAAMDLDGDDLDELVALGGEGGWWTFECHSPLPTPCAPLAQGSVTALLGRGVASAIGRDGWGAAPVLVDLDGDGSNEIVTLGATAVSTSHVGQVVVLRGAGQGTLEALQLSLPDPMPPGLEQATPVALAPIEVNGTQGDELLIVLGSADSTAGEPTPGAIVATADLAARALVEPLPVALPTLVHELRISGAWRLDFDGDGAHDLVLAGSSAAGSRLVLLRGVPATP